MKRVALDFVRRGVCAMGFGPIVLAVVYLILHSLGVIDSLTATDVCTGILSLTLLAFFAGGLNAIYRLERLPLMLAIFIHGAVLYICYLVTYLLNAWFVWDIIHFIVFTAVFVVGYIVIWVTVYSIVKKNTAKLNEALREKQQNL